MFAVACYFPIDKNTCLHVAYMHRFSHSICYCNQFDLVMHSSLKHKDSVVRRNMMSLLGYSFLAILIKNVMLQSPKPKLVAVPELSTVEESEGFIKSNDVTVIGFFSENDSVEAMNYLESVDQMFEHNISFAMTNDPSVFDFHSVKDDTILLFNSHINEKKVFKVKPFNWKAIVNFVLPNSLPQLIEFEPKLVSRIISARKGALFVILDSNAKDFQSLKNIVRIISTKYHTRCYVVIVDAANDINKNILNILRVDENEVPCLRYSPSWGTNFIPSSNKLEEINIKQFVEDSLAFKAKRITWKRSEDIPVNWNTTAVKILVGKNFHEVVSNVKYCFVQFFAPNCSECDTTLQIWEQLGQRLKNNKDIMIAKMDATLNEVDNVWVFTYPSFYLYKYSPLNSFKSHRHRTVEELLGFLHRHGLNINPIHDAKDEL